VKVNFEYTSAMQQHQNETRVDVTKLNAFAGKRFDTVRNGQAANLTVSDKVVEVEGLVQSSYAEMIEKVYAKRMASIP
jgi:hypothetical protein